MIQPFLADLLTGAIPHRLVDIIAGLIGEQTVYPYKALVLGLVTELRLTVDGPGKKPGRISCGNNTACHNTAAERIAMADILDIRDDLIIQRRHRCTHPVRLLRIVIELFRMSERRILQRNAVPHIPASAFMKTGIKRSRLVLASDGCIFHASAVCDEYKIIFCQRDEFLLAVSCHFDGRCSLLLSLNIELDVINLYAVFEADAKALQILDHRENHGFILVITGEAKRREIRKSSDMMYVSLQITLHLQCGVPVLKCKHRAPVHPEVGVKNLFVEDLIDSLIVQILIRGQIQLHNFLCTLVGESEFLIGMCILSSFLRRAAQGVIRILLIQPVILIQHTDSRRLDRGNRTEQVPHALEMVVHLASAAHHVADIIDIQSIAGTARYLVLLEDMNIASLHLPVTH